MELKFKKIKAITKIAKDTKVVNFSVKKNENYFANGILTHNCYMKRHKPEGLSVATNINEILTAIDHHAWFADVEKPNQTHPEYVTYDISCNEDFALHAKYHEWERIFEFFRDHPKAMGSFATKYVNNELLNFNPEQKIRIRFSMIPEEWREILEPNTSRIVDRLDAVSKFLDAGYEVHLNFSPVIFHENWLKQYDLLFQTVEYWSRLRNWNKENVKAEVIFLTHNEKKHWYNLLHDLPGENLLWKPEIQESKKSQYGGENIRYKHDLKVEFIREWTQLHDQIIPWNTVRYIF